MTEPPEGTYYIICSKGPSTPILNIRGGQLKIKDANPHSLTRSETLCIAAAPESKVLYSSRHQIKPSGSSPVELAQDSGLCYRQLHQNILWYLVLYWPASQAYASPPLRLCARCPVSPWLCLLVRASAGLPWAQYSRGAGESYPEEGGSTGGAVKQELWSH